ncbi:hypothetical protein FHY55_03085 [Oceanicola sp. D3]|uniref:hypothetical protein n=1 Tax=Oceanicola sp. D3 TaxID=2587163 RepID=UPI0011221483|nr:hypothetical protein [Oceanicola sp. D3]QDC08287.1 hypothetical protein FHY55_03085 [Oceanicola sp. D3]
MKRLLTVICLAASLAACTTLNPVTAARLSRLDPLTADPAAIAARLRLPEGLAIQPGGAVLSISAIRKDTGERLAETFELEPSGTLWRLSEPDIATMREAQDRAARWKREAPDQSSGALSLSLTGCSRSTGARSGPDPEAPISADVSLDGGASFLPLIRGLTVADLAKAAGTGTAIGPCTTAPPKPR